MSDRPRTCPRCGALLADGSPLGELCPRCLVSLALEPPEGDDGGDAPGRAFGPYRLIEQIGEGGMGIVWLARQEHPIRRDVALKVVKPGADSAQVLSRFESERQALAILNHPNIATVFDAGLTDDGRPYFAMEYVPGLAITAFADQHALPITARLELFLQVCEAVEHAHQKGVVHRDLKPANILVGDRNGRAVVKVIDFGVAKALGPSLSAETMATQIGTLVGTPEYMSPEQAGLTEAVVDTRTDIYSLGLVLYELLVGALPFDAAELRRKAVLEMLRVIREDEPPRLASRLTGQSDVEIKEIAKRRLTEPRSLVRQLRGDLEWITTRALEKEPARRYASASELGADVRRHLATEPVVAGPPDLRYRLGKLVRRHRGAAIGAGIALAALVVAAVVSSIMWVSAERARRENRARLKALHVTTGLELATEGDDLKALPWLVRAMQLEEGGARAEDEHRIRIDHLLSTAPYPVRIWRHEGLAGAYLAPDRTTLATWDSDGALRVWDAARGETIAGPLDHKASLVSVRLAGSRAVTADNRGTLRVWDTRNGKEAVAPIAQGAGVLLVRIAAGGDRFLSADRAGTITVRALDSGSVITTIRLERRADFVEFLDEGRTIAAGDETATTLIIDGTSGQTLARLEQENESGIVDVARLDGDRVATTTGRGVVQVWDVRTGAAQGERTPVVPNGIYHVRVSPGGVTSWMCGGDGAVIALIGRPTEPRRLGTRTNCQSIDASGEGLLAAAAYTDGTVLAWSGLGEAFTPRLPHGAAVTLVGFLAASHQLLTVDDNGLIRVWELKPGAPWTRVNRGYTWGSDFSPDGRRLVLATGSSSPPNIGQAVVLDAATGEPLLPPLRHGGNVRFIEHSPDGKLMATASDDGTARLWDAVTGEPVSPVLRHPTGPMTLATFNPDGRRVATFGNASPSSSDVAVWEVPNGRRVAVLPDTATAFSGEFSEDGRHLLTIDPAAKRVQLWRFDGDRPVLAANLSPYAWAAFLSNSEVVLTGLRTVDVVGLDGAPTRPAVPLPQGAGIGVSRDHTTIFVGAESGAIHVLDSRDLTWRFAPLRFFAGITSADLSADNRWLAATTVERRARVWSMESGEPLSPARSVRAMPLSVSFSPDGSRVQFGGSGVTVWNLRRDERPVPALDALAQLLSGHELAGTELVALPADRLIALSRDPRLTPVESPGSERNWRWMVVNQHLFQRDWTAALAALTPLAADQQATWDVHDARGEALAELGRWSEAQKAFAAALARRPDWTAVAYHEAVARAGGGDESAFDQACTAALQKFGATRNPDRAHWLARLCVLAPTLDQTATARVRDLARIAADIEGDIGRHLSVYAAALIRANEPAVAEKLLLDLLARPRVREREEESELILAAAQRRLGRVRDAQATLLRFDAAGHRSSPWYRRVEATILRRWAEGRE
jgi:serine/threonine protein kinase/WD40 repeat protein